MSILLDALKKSEEQRQLGSAPNIHAGPNRVPGGRSDRLRPWIPMALVLAAALTMSWLGWQQYRKPETVGAAETAQAASEAASSAEAARPAPRKPGLTAGRTPVESLDQASDRGTPDAGNEELVQRREAIKDSFDNYQAEAAEGLEQQPETMAESDALAAVRESVADDVTPAVASAQPQESAEAFDSSPADTQGSQPISYWELPQSVRDNLPEIRITVLVYAATPEDRFALINGQRMVEADEVSAGVVLREIRREGVVLTYRNYRFMVKG